MTSKEKIFKNLNVTYASGIDQISLKFFKTGAPVIAIHTANIINLPLKLDTFPSKCKIAKIKTGSKKEITLKLKSIDLFVCCP